MTVCGKLQETRGAKSGHIRWQSKLTPFNIQMIFMDWLDGWDAFEESYNMSKPYLFGKWSKMDLQSFIRHQKRTCIRICLDDVRYGTWNLRQNRKQIAESSLQDTGDWFTRPWTGLKADHPMFNLENQSKKYRMFVCM